METHGKRLSACRRRHRGIHELACGDPWKDVVGVSASAPFFFLIFIFFFIFFYFLINNIILIIFIIVINIYFNLINY